jgi:hypothetical protein
MSRNCSRSSWLQYVSRRDPPGGGPAEDRPQSADLVGQLGNQQQLRRAIVADRPRQRTIGVHAAKAAERQDGDDQQQHGNAQQQLVTNQPTVTHSDLQRRWISNGPAVACFGDSSRLTPMPGSWSCLISPKTSMHPLAQPDRSSAIAKLILQIDRGTAAPWEEALDPPEPPNR